MKLKQGQLLAAKTDVPCDENVLMRALVVWDLKKEFDLL
jgi:hypothetical protein